MRLNDDQWEPLQEALVSAFPSISKLRMMVKLKLKKNLNVISESNELSEVTFTLIETADTEGWMENLITAAREHIPGNELLNKFHDGYFTTNSFLNKNQPITLFEERKTSIQELKKEQAVTEPSYRALNQYYFDLEALIEQSLSELDGQRGLVGLAVPCDDDAFQENFCQRLKDEIGRSNIQIKRPLALNPLVNSVERAVRVIKGYKQILQIGEIICPIQVQVFDPNSSIPDKFWQIISAEFENTSEHRLIMLMVGSEDSVFPKGVIKIEAPKFTTTHVHRWVVKVTKYQGWAEQVIGQWKQHMIAGCCLDDPKSGLLDIRYVYDYLDYTMQLLQGSHSAEAFLQELEQRS